MATRLLVHFVALGDEGICACPIRPDWVVTLVVAPDYQADLVRRSPIVDGKLLHLPTTAFRARVS